MQQGVCVVSRGAVNVPDRTRGEHRPLFLLLLFQSAFAALLVPGATPRAKGFNALSGRYV